MTRAQAVLKRIPATIALGLLLSASTVPAHAADPNEFSQAEKLVFVERHLTNVKAPSSLRYSFVKSGSLEPGFEDVVRMDIKRNATGCCAVHGEFLTGERRLNLPDIEDAEPNPVIMFFLEREVRELAKLTKRKDGGNYFRNRIRRSMVDEAQVRDTTVTFEGRQLPAREVTLTPYATDPARVRYERYAGKRYTFLLAQGVPGGVYQIRTVLPGALASDPPAQEEVLTLVGPEAAASSSTNKK